MNVVRKIKRVDVKLAKMIEDGAKERGIGEAQFSRELAEEFEEMRMNKKRFKKTLEQLSGIRLYK